jgi:hypothetical protein
MPEYAIKVPIIMIVTVRIISFREPADTGSAKGAGFVGTVTAGLRGGRLSSLTGVL